MKILIGTKTDQIELAGVEWIILDKLDLEIHVDGQWPGANGGKEE